MKQSKTIKKLHRSEIRKKLRSNGLRQCEAASLIGCNETQLSKYINGWINLPHKHLLKLNDLLDPDARLDTDNKTRPLYEKGDKVLDVKGAAELLKVCEKTLRSHLDEIPHKRIGRSIRFLHTELLKYLKTP
jgi:predicted transcriptional regulator